MITCALNDIAHKKKKVLSTNIILMIYSISCYCTRSVNAPGFGSFTKACFNSLPNATVLLFTFFCSSLAIRILKFITRCFLPILSSLVYSAGLKSSVLSFFSVHIFLFPFLILCISFHSIFLKVSSLPPYSV